MERIFYIYINKHLLVAMCDSLDRLEDLLIGLLVDVDAVAVPRVIDEREKHFEKSDFVMNGVRDGQARILT